MKMPDGLILIAASLGLGWLLVNSLPVTPAANLVDNSQPIYRYDTARLNTVKVDGQKVLFIGDSHTAYRNGWQDQLSRKTGMIARNTAVGGKRTQWMVQVAKEQITSEYNFCFIWGGANDMASQVGVEKAVSNVQAIVDICNAKGVRPIVLTGFHPYLCIDISKASENWALYPGRYFYFQEKLLKEIKNATVIKNHYITRKDGDCADFVCHMSASGHRKMADSLIVACNFQIRSK